MSKIINFGRKKNEMKVPTRAAPPPPTHDKSWSASMFDSKDETGISTVKKKAPPRPPPPKLPVHRDGRSFDYRHSHKSTSSNSWETWTSDCLIDWSSPPSSPSSATRSNSDALSVNSFGSDSVNASSGSTSNVESGFEDDFDMLVSSGGSKPFDPWSPPPPAPQPMAKLEPRQVKPVFSSCVPNKLAMPTIIRAKPERPKVPKILEKKYELNALAEVFEKSTLQCREVVDEDEGWSSDSPPMPSCPPPAPPPVLLSNLLIHSENKRSCIDTDTGDTAVALYDYQGVDGDLSFRQGDRVKIIRHIDCNWVEASMNGRTGTAPVNHLQVKSGESSRIATALYPFIGETWEDLTLQQGDTVTLLSRINAEWLYGQIADRRGQFPATFVDHVPADLPSSNGPSL